MDLGILERINRAAAHLVEGIGRMMQPRRVDSIRDLVSPEAVCFLTAHDRDAALAEMVGVAARAGLCPCPEAFLQAVLEREKIVSTGIGLGVAIPHAKIADQPDFFITIGIAPEGIDWGAIDGEPCRLLFLIGGPENRPNDYLQVLSALTALLREEEVRKNMLKSSRPLDILSSFKGF